jgi:hypothetical protein
MHAFNNNILSHNIPKVKKKKTHSSEWAMFDVIQYYSVNIRERTVATTAITTSVIMPCTAPRINPFFSPAIK